MSLLLNPKGEALLLEILQILSGLTTLDFDGVGIYGSGALHKRPHRPTMGAVFEPTQASVVLFPSAILSQQTDFAYHVFLTTCRPDS